MNRLIKRAIQGAVVTWTLLGILVVLAPGLGRAAGEHPATFAALHGGQVNLYVADAQHEPDDLN